MVKWMNPNQKCNLEKTLSGNSFLKGEDDYVLVVLFQVLTAFQFEIPNNLWMKEK